MKKILSQCICAVILILGILLPFTPVTEAKETVTDIISQERYLKINNAINTVFIDTVENKGFLPSNTLYTLYKNDNNMTLSFYNLFVEYDLDNEKEQLEVTNYFSAIEELGLTASLQKDKTIIVQEKDELALFEKLLIQLMDYVDLENGLLKVEISFDDIGRPDNVTFYDSNNEGFFWYKITYISMIEYNFNFIFRKLSEPVYRAYYTIKYFMDQHILQGLLAIFILLSLIVLAILLLLNFCSWLYTKRTKKSLATKNKVWVLFIIGVFVYSLLLIVPYGILILLPLDIIGGGVKAAIFFFKKVFKRE
ncbi:hypothetical protein I6N96_13670 [Enterococcus sp. BWM-S5]|uniref:DUF1189 domain-containing protein n=1 Tax=Enterococcus larvae TaxID=2794352 RepID=A0ABS4CL42_9ENTE|nr:hypothetical protein [Enterococcus larvae]MBP1047327.1 hypothetical protein [Enterococcus larvae]